MGGIMGCEGGEQESLLQSRVDMTGATTFWCIAGNIAEIAFFAFLYSGYMYAELSKLLTTRTLHYFLFFSICQPPFVDQFASVHG